MKKIIKSVFVIFSVSVVSVTAGLVSAGEVRYTTDIKPLFDRHCAGCHGAASPEYPEFSKNKEKFKGEFKGPRMDSYSYLIYFTGWPDTGALMRRLDDGGSAGTGKAGNMYQYLGATDEERRKNLKLFKDWVGNWTLKRESELTIEDLRGIKVAY